MKTIQEMLQELSQCIVTVSGEFRFRTNWNGGKVPQPEPEKPDLDVFDPNVPFCIENVGDVPASVQYNTNNTNIRISKDYKTWNDYTSGTEIELNPTDRVYIKSDYVLNDSGTPKFHFTNANGTRLRARGNIASLIYGTGDEYITKYTIATQYCYKSMFDNCTSLTQAPELPATTLASNCYNSMFSGCTGLTQAPELPATTLADYCYRFMFNGCASLTQAPELPATTLADYCYDSMFQHCISLTQAPNLPATTLAQSCYIMMFRGCTGLTQAPALPATTLAKNCYDSMFVNCASLTQAPELLTSILVDYCYDSMFSGCTSLTQAPELPATTLAYGCYSYMFEGCTGLTQAPELSATTLADYCYYSMFSGCTKLNFVKCLATDASATDCTKNWLSGVASTGTFECDNKKYFTVDSPNGIPVGWTITEINPAQPEPEKPDLDTFDPNVPFCIENVGDVPASVQYNTKNTNIRVSKDYKTWNDYTTGTEIELNPADRVYIKSDYVKDIGSSPRFVFNGNGAQLRARGNIASLLYGSNDAYVNKYTSTEERCYSCMFQNCKGLTQAPELPATTLASSCYGSMFSGCVSLTQAPELPTITLANYCYGSMFSGCTSLTQAPELPATTLADGCYGSMFYGCSSLTQAPELPAINLNKRCYSNMFRGCTKLTNTPNLPATTLEEECYYNMFLGCTSITIASRLPAMILALSCYDGMFYNCKSLVQAPELPAITLANYCYSQMFCGCESLVQAPELPATVLAGYCYYAMFRYCYRLKYVKCLATDTSAYNCTDEWLIDVSYKGTFECDNKKYFTVDSPNGIPSGWTITEINPDPPTPPEPEKPDLDVFDPNVPFCIENVGDVPVEIGLYNYDKKNTAIVRTNCKISYDLKTWSDYTIVLTANTNSVDINKITLSNKGDRVYIKADKNKIDTTDLKVSDIPSTRIKVINQSSETKIRARGNIASLNKGTNDAYKTNYLTMSTNDNLCYHSMFYDCTSLTQAPELPATKLLSWCYSHMFYGCTLLEVAPSLPSTTLANYCYDSMFSRCTSLTQAPKLPATTLKNSCYNYMFELCKNLTQAPELPATTLIRYCYNGMFWGCSKLNYIKCLATDISAEHCTLGWLYNVSGTGDFYTPAATNWKFDAYGIPTGWKRHDI